jgi:hypothetical protein
MSFSVCGFGAPRLFYFSRLYYDEDKRLGMESLCHVRHVELGDGR